jgi:hypothetical protein
MCGLDVMLWDGLSAARHGYEETKRISEQNGAHVLPAENDAPLSGHLALPAIRAHCCTKNV